MDDRPIIGTIPEHRPRLTMTESISTPVALERYATAAAAA
jgi:hypothetical protein